MRRFGGLHRLFPQDANREVVQQRVEHRDHEQRQQRRRDQPADHRVRHRGSLLGPFTDREGQRQHAENHRRRRHDDRTEPDARRREDRLSPVRARLTLLVHEVDHQDAVLGHETHQHDDADHRHHVDAPFRHP